MGLPDGEIDLVEAATVLANARLGTGRPYSSIPTSLAPHLRRASRILKPGALPEEKIEALNKELLPAIRKGAEDEFRWLADSLGGGEGGNCVVLTLLYMIAADAISLRLDAVCLPFHVFPCHVAGGRQRRIEIGRRGEHLTIPEYRDYLSDDPLSPEAIPEDAESQAKHFAPLTRRQFVALLLSQSGGKKEKNPLDYEAAARIAPDFYYPLKMLSAYYGRDGQFDKGDEVATKAIGLAPHVPALYLTRSVCRLKNHQLMSAREDVETALKLSPHFGQYHYFRSLILEEQGRLWEALDAATLAVDNGSKVPDFRRSRGRLYGKLRKYKEAISDFSTIIALDPKDAGAYDERSKMWAMLGAEAEYEADRKRAMELREQER